MRPVFFPFSPIPLQAQTMPSTLLKLSIVASTYGKTHHLNKWFCRSTASPAAPSAAFLSYSTKIGPPVPSMCSRALRIFPCASLGLPARDSNSICRKLGFRGQQICNSSVDKSGGGVVGSSMGPDNHNDRLPSRDCDQKHRQQQFQPRQQNSDKLLTLPTILTIGRVAAVPLLISTFYMNSWWGTTCTTSIFIAAAITDWLDGYLARRMNLGTAFGAFLDPVADKLMVAATLVLLCTRPPEVAMFGQLPWLLTVPSIAIIGREITMSAVREWAACQGSKLSEAVAVNNLGKWKTATQMISITILLATRDSSFTEMGFLLASGVAMLYISAGLAVWSLVVYMRKIWKVLLM